MTPAKKALCRAVDGEVLQTTWGQLVWTASGQIGNSISMSFGRVVIRAGQENPRHRHPNCDEILHVVSGRIEHTLGEEIFSMGPGDSISIPQGVWHQARALGEDAVIVICFNSSDRLTEVEGQES
jgi:quercetin dioxygenase-like cupin family protein